MQPILTVVKRPTIRLDPTAVLERPDVAARIAGSIACFSRVETTVSSLFTNLLGVNMVSGATLYNSMNSAPQKAATLRSLALASLSEKEMLAFNAISTIVKRHQGTRDKIAHWYWGLCEELADGLVVVDPRYLMAYRAQILDWRDKGDMRGASLDHDKIFAVRLRDLDATMEAFSTVSDLVFKLANLAAEPQKQKRAERLRQLFADDMVQADLPPNVRSAIQRSLRARPKLPQKPRQK